MRYLIVFISTLALVYLGNWLQNWLADWLVDWWHRPSRPPEQPMEQHGGREIHRTGRLCEYCDKSKPEITQGEIK